MTARIVEIDPIGPAGDAAIVDTTDTLNHAETADWPRQLRRYCQQKSRRVDLPLQYDQLPQHRHRPTRTAGHRRRTLVGGTNHTEPGHDHRTGPRSPVPRPLDCKARLPTSVLCTSPLMIPHQQRPNLSVPSAEVNERLIMLTAQLEASAGDSWAALGDIGLADTTLFFSIQGTAD
ncbi:MAG: hypothetical protein ACJATT_001304 [Myxococcota bacterium]|jgi:hypothetical protein